MSKFKGILDKVYSPMVIALALRNLRLNKFRTILSMIGIVIGVFAICTMGMASAGFTAEIDNVVSDSADTLQLTSISEKIIDGEICMGFSEKDLRNIQSAVSSVSKKYEIVPLYTTTKRMTIGKEQVSASIYGMSSKDADKMINLLSGSFPRNGKSVIVGEKFAENNNLKLGSRISMNGVDGEKLTVSVVGIMESTGMMSFSIPTDNAVIGTIEWYTSAAGDNHGLYNQVIVKSYDPVNELNEIEDAIERKMNGKKDDRERPDGRKSSKTEDNVFIINSYEIMNLFDEIMSMSSVFTTAISAISLLVAAVAIMNVMLMSVKERTREVGILRSIGTFRGQILQMFLYEAGLIGVIGSAIGVALSCIVIPPFLLLMTESAAAMLTPGVLMYIPVGILIGLLVCLVSGLYPAWKAANLNPVEAMSTD